MPWREAIVALLATLVWHLWQIADSHPSVLIVALAALVVFCFSQCGRLRQLGFEYLAWDWPGRRWCWRGLLAGGVMVACTALLYQAAHEAAPVSIPGPSNGSRPSIATLMMLVSFVPLVEECVFRGYLFRMLFAVGGAVSSHWVSAIAICGTAILFAAAHSAGAWSAGHFLRIATTFSTGLVFATLRHRSASTVPGVVAHATYNAGIVLLGTAVGQGT